MNTENARRAARSYVIEATIAIALCYFLFGGSDWSPALWAIFAILAIWIVVMNMRRDASVDRADVYDRWKLQVAFLLVAGFFGASIWSGSLWLVVFSLALWAIWISDFRAYRTIHGSRAETSSSSH